MRILLYMILMLSCELLLSQNTIDREVICSSGETKISQGLSISYSVGEVLINSESSSNWDISDGFQQNYINQEATFLHKEISNQLDIRFFPNPTSGILFFDVRDNVQMKNIQLFDIAGTIVIEMYQSLGQKYIDLSELPTGVYLLKITTNQNKLLNKKIIKNK